MDDGEVKILIELTRDQTDDSIFSALESKNKVEASKLLLRYLFLKNKELQALIVSTKARIEKKLEVSSADTLQNDKNRMSEYDTLMRKVQLEQDQNNKRSFLLNELKNNIVILLVCFVLVGFVYIRVMPVGLALSLYVFILFLSLGYSYFSYRNKREARNMQNAKQRLFKKPEIKQILESKLLSDLDNITENLNTITTKVNTIAKKNM